VGGWFTDDTVKRFESYGWQVIADVDGHDSTAIAAAIEQAAAETERPSLICCKTIIGFGSPNKQGTASTHGAPLGDEEIAATRKELGWDAAPFDIPADVADAWNGKSRGAAAEQEWQKVFDEYASKHPDLAAEYLRRTNRELPAGWSEFADKAIADIDAAAENMATRKASLLALNAFAPMLPELAGGSADLTGSNLTRHSGSTVVTGDDAAGNYIYFGVREFGMTALCNGMSLHGGLIPYSGTFLTFSDYARNALRMAALMKTQNILVYTHDSIGLGEDGPVAWRNAIERRDGPTSLVLTRQGLPHQDRDKGQLAAIARGGYVLKDSGGELQIILIATGSEVALAMSAADVLAADGVAVRVVSMPCTDLFDAQGADYREQVLPAAVTARVAIEAGVTEGWWRYVGAQGRVIGLDRFGESAPANELFEHFGFSTDNVVAVARELF